jgi:hypothetical protein
MAALTYWYEFDSLAIVAGSDPKVRRKYRVEIWDMRALAGSTQAREVHACGEEMFKIEWPTVEKFAPIVSSVATFELASEDDFEFTGLHTEDIQHYQVRLLEVTGGGTADVWRGWLNTETYEEQLCASAGDNRVYPVRFYASDFNVLKRMKFVDVENGGKQYTGMKPLEWFLDLILVKRLGLVDGGHLRVDISTVLAGYEEIPPFLWCGLDCGNWYDEDGEAATLQEVVEEILRPFVAWVQGAVEGGVLRLLITDYNRVLGDDRYSLPAPLLEMIDGRGGASGGLLSDGAFGFESLLNGLTVTSSRYADNTLQTWEVRKEDLEGEPFASEIARYKGRPNGAELMLRERYHSAKNFPVILPEGSPVEFWYMKDLAGGQTEEVWVCLNQALGDMADTFYPNIVFEDRNNRLYPNSDARLKINMDIKVAQRNHTDVVWPALPNFLDTQKYNYQISPGGVIVWTRLEVVDGEDVVCHLECGWAGSAAYAEKVRPAVWVRGADPSPNGGSVMFTVRNSREIEGTKGLNNGTYQVSWANGALDEINQGISGIEMPPNAGYLRWTIGQVQVCGQYYQGDWTWMTFSEWYKYIGRIGEPYELWGVLINNVKFGVEDSYKYALSDEDVVYTSSINMNAEKSMTDIMLKVCNSYAPNMAPGKGDLFQFGFFPMTAAGKSFVRKGRTANLERLLVGSYHSNHTGLFKRFVASIAWPDPFVGKKCKYGRYSRGPRAGEWIIPGNGEAWYWVRGLKVDFRGGTSELDCVEISEDNRDIDDITARKG